MASAQPPAFAVACYEGTTHTTTAGGSEDQRVLVQRVLDRAERTIIERRFTAVHGWVEESTMRMSVRGNHIDVGGALNGEGDLVGSSWVWTKYSATGRTPLNIAGERSAEWTDSSLQVHDVFGGGKVDVRGQLPHIECASFATRCRALAWFGSNEDCEQPYLEWTPSGFE
jgi:hypothetical protein